MAAKINAAYGKGPWNMKKNAIKEFMQVTPVNENVAKVLGRIFYVITLNGSVHQFLGTFSIDPCFTKGFWQYPIKPWQTGFPGHQRTFMPEDMNYDNWASTNKIMISGFIKKGELYIKAEDPILKYYKD